MRFFVLGPNCANYSPHSRVFHCFFYFFYCASSLTRLCLKLDGFRPYPSHWRLFFAVAGTVSFLLSTYLTSIGRSRKTSCVANFPLKSGLGVAYCLNSCCRCYFAQIRRHAGRISSFEQYLAKSLPTQFSTFHDPCSQWAVWISGERKVICYSQYKLPPCGCLHHFSAKVFLRFSDITLGWSERANRLLNPITNSIFYFSCWWSFRKSPASTIDVDRFYDRWSMQFT